MSAIFSAALGLTHQLSTIFMVAVLVPYFALFAIRERVIPKCFLGVILGGTVAYVTFYEFAWQSMYYYYTNFAPVYDQSSYVTSSIMQAVGPLLLLSATLALTFAFAHEGRGFVAGKEILLIWLIVPFCLAYAYLLGVQWPGVRWTNFIPQPLVVWAGIGLGYSSQKQIVLILFALLFTIQLLLYVTGAV
jgi:hypothetical protein